MLRCGSTLLKCTDGLIERRRIDPDVGTDALCRVVRSPAAATSEEIWVAVVDHAGPSFEDDVAVLAIHLCEVLPSRRLVRVKPGAGRGDPGS